MFSASCPLRNSPAVEVVPRFVPNSGTLQRIPAHEHVLRVGMLTWQSLPGEARSCWLETWGMGRDLPLGSEFEVAPASPGFARRSDCTSVAWAPRGSESGRRPSLADYVRGRRPPGRRPSPQRANVAYAHRRSSRGSAPRARSPDHRLRCGARARSGPLAETAGGGSRRAVQEPRGRVHRARRPRPRAGWRGAAHRGARRRRSPVHPGQRNGRRRPGRRRHLRGPSAPATGIARIGIAAETFEAFALSCWGGVTGPPGWASGAGVTATRTRRARSWPRPTWWSGGVRVSRGLTSPPTHLHDWTLCRHQVQAVAFGSSPTLCCCRSSWLFGWAESSPPCGVPSVRVPETGTTN